MFSLPKEALMYRTIVIATITLGAISLPIEPSLALGHGNAPTTSVASTALHVPPKLGSGAATAASACYRACMHGMDSSMENFCGVSCF
jgi:hypothetical protein